MEVPLPIQGREGLAPGAGAQGAGQWPVLRPLPPAELPPPPDAPCHTGCCGPGNREPSSTWRRGPVYCTALALAGEARPPSPSLASPAPSVASRLPAFPGVRGGRPAAVRAGDGLHHCDEGGHLLGVVVPALQACGHRLGWGKREASAGPRTPSGPPLWGHGPQRPGCWRFWPRGQEEQAGGRGASWVTMEHVAWPSLHRGSPWPRRPWADWLSG